VSTPGPTRTWPITIGDVELFVLESTNVDDLLDAAIDDGSVAPYGVVLWHSAVAVAERLSGYGSLEGVRVLDVGTGTGLCSLLAATRGADVLAVDVIEPPLQLLQEAARQQGLSIKTATFDIFSDDPLPDADLVIVADLLYEHALARQAGLRVVEAVRRGSRVLVGDPERAFRGAFSRVLERADIGVRWEIAYAKLAADQRAQRCGVLEVGG
jgi:predicted nicotinamide N-methyase